MSRKPWLHFGLFLPLMAALLLVLAIACGQADEPTAAPTEAVVEPTEAMTPEPTVEAMTPEPTVEAMTPEPTGGHDAGAYGGHDAGAAGGSARRQANGSVSH